MSVLVNTNCPNCGAGIQVDPNVKQKMFCMYCGTPFMTKDIITNNTYINNNTVIYNDNSSSTYAGIMGRRRVYIEELRREVLYFSLKGDQYEEMDSIKYVDIPLAAYKKSDGLSNFKGMAWAGYIGGAFCTLLFIPFLVGNMPLGGCIALVVFTLIFASMIFLYHFFEPKYQRKNDEVINDLYERGQYLYNSLIQYYNEYGECLVGFEYTYPDILKEIYSNVESGRAESVRESIDLYTKSQTYERIGLRVLSKYKRNEWPKALTEFVNRTGLQVAQATPLLTQIREKAYRDGLLRQ